MKVFCVPNESLKHFLYVFAGCIEPARHRVINHSHCSLLNPFQGDGLHHPLSLLTHFQKDLRFHKNVAIACSRGSFNIAIQYNCLLTEKYIAFLIKKNFPDSDLHPDPCFKCLWGLRNSNLTKKKIILTPLGEEFGNHTLTIFGYPCEKNITYPSVSYTQIYVLSI